MVILTFGFKRKNKIMNLRVDPILYSSVTVRSVRVFLHVYRIMLAHMKQPLQSITHFSINQVSSNNIISDFVSYLQTLGNSATSKFFWSFKPDFDCAAYLTRKNKGPTSWIVDIHRRVLTQTSPCGRTLFVD